MIHIWKDFLNFYDDHLESLFLNLDSSDDDYEKLGSHFDSWFYSVLETWVVSLVTVYSHLFLADGSFLCLLHSMGYSLCNFFVQNEFVSL